MPSSAFAASRNLCHHRLLLVVVLMLVVVFLLFGVIGDGIVVVGVVGGRIVVDGGGIVVVGGGIVVVGVAIEGVVVFCNAGIVVDVDGDVESIAANQCFRWFC